MLFPKSSNFLFSKSINPIARSQSLFSRPHSLYRLKLHTQVPKNTAAIMPTVEETFVPPKTFNKAKLVDFACSSYYNNGTALPLHLREQLNMRGQTPSIVESFQKQADRALKTLRSKHSPLEKYTFMAQLRNNNTRLFYKLVNDHIEEFAPIIYTPTVGEACLQYSSIYPFLTPPGTPDGLYLTLNDLPHMDEILQAYKQRTGETPDITVITDGSRILGLGDLGINGMPISMGKLQLYVAGAGIDPRKTLPIVLDFGTNNESNLQNEFYLGVRQKRPEDPEFYAAVDQVLKSLVRNFPNLLVQFEDFSTEHAFGLLKNYQNKLLCFNDDIQGTGAVILSGLINAFRKVESESKVPLNQHRIVFYGAGSAAIGVAQQIQEYLESEYNLSEEEARNMFYICDSKGLVTADRGDKLPEHKVYYARRDNNGLQLKNLEDIVDYIKPTTLIGLSSCPGAFNKDVLKRMSTINKQPIVFPLSNPATKAECTFEDAMKATNNNVIFASGTAFPAYLVPETNQTRYPGQGNNMYMFPGLGLGAILGRPESITNRLILRASKALADSLTDEERAKGLLYPELSRIRDISAVVASSVIEQAVKDKIATSDDVNSLHPDEYLNFVKSRMWSPNYDDIE
ncbi:uncharacterized protein BX663DRAFT_502438 [Cokeromyces recurvatus]|uniref:uncharacterized protein n=1 Tax=Cokeromyces recurvatus TaxID=90255 RepID=UPI00221F1B5A|nr:uncharacterized protein BX663DRAFT_502438 [Cokeromyces recurvatus]KAI7905320.1 hypothetical protein BX663DRAFT_502438 [Cokeromyces recurvatus]